MTQPELALIVAIRAHKNQKRIRGELYLNHLVRVGEQFESPTMRAAGYLHDIIEDCPNWDYKDLEEAGLYPVVIDLVRVLTHDRANESYVQYLDRIKDDHMAMQIKLADIKDNLAESPFTSMEDKHELALRYLND
jgi:(p)ppGpp synthase/HD superfamily hydrolase